MPKDSTRSAAAKQVWARIREIAEAQNISVQEARQVLAAEKRGETPTPKEPSVSEATAQPKTKKSVDLVAAEKKLRAKYPHVIAGTLKLPEGGSRKRSVEIACQHPGCKSRRRVFTSDLFQVKFCEEHKPSRPKKKE